MIVPIISPTEPKQLSAFLCAISSPLAEECGSDILYDSIAVAGRQHLHPPSSPDGPESADFVPAPDGIFECPNGHESPIALDIADAGEKLDGHYCMVCWLQFITQHTPRVRLVQFDD